MSNVNIQLPDLTLANGAALSNILNSNAFEDAESLTLYAPAALDAGTYTLEGNPDPAATAASANWATLQIGDPAADANPPPAGKIRVYYEWGACSSIRIRCSINQTAGRTFKATKSCFM